MSGSTNTSVQGATMVADYNNPLYMHPFDTPGSQIAQQWDRCDAPTSSWIMNTILNDLVARVIYGNNAVTLFFTVNAKPVNNSAQGTKQKKPMECEYCHMANHTVNFCWKLHGYPDNRQRNKQKEGTNYKTHVANHSESLVMDDLQRTSASMSKP
ncbi:hypothetical protein Patl1_29173 [Pistacia atlantica]|uniref:Uncharacterized protein n=1 Tax=Pistacia atlantica TaxID=434234 RepID=A0ACC1BDB4_9ROSI|nr:hypothetical protein Patl1_29173 [Pistacia atlantica]